MKTFLLACTLLVSASLFAQTNTDTLHTEEYCILRIDGIIFSMKVNVNLDYGQPRRNYRESRLRDEETGKSIRFNSEVDALNYMGEQGWTLVNAFPVISKGSSCTQYIFKRSKVLVEENDRKGS